MNYFFREKKDSANMNNAFNPVTKLKNLLVDLFDIDIIIIMITTQYNAWLSANYYCITKLLPEKVLMDYIDFGKAAVNIV